MDNVHTLNDFSNNNSNNIGNRNLIGESSNNNQSEQFSFNNLFPKQIYNMKTVSFIIICIIVACFILQLLIYYIFYKSNGYSWNCLLLNLGASETSKVVNHYHYHRLFTPIILHNNFSHLFSNAISLLFIGFYVEYEIRNKINYIILFVGSGIFGNLASLLFGNNNISSGSSGAIIGLCGYFVIYFILNFEKMGHNQKCCYGIFFLILFLNLFAGIPEGNNIDMFSHLGGFLGGLAISMILIYRSRIEYRFNQKVMIYLNYAAIIYVITVPILTLVAINMRNIIESEKFVCFAKMK